MVNLGELIQSTHYRTGDGKLHKITEMDDGFLRRAIEYLERKAETKIKAGTPDKFVFSRVYSSLIEEQRKREYAKVSSGICCN